MLATNHHPRRAPFPPARVRSVHAAGKLDGPGARRSDRLPLRAYLA
jgi:hypothetical protein